MKLRKILEPDYLTSEGIKNKEIAKLLRGMKFLGFGVAIFALFAFFMTVILMNDWWWSICVSYGFASVLLILMRWSVIIYERERQVM